MIPHHRSFNSLGCGYFYTFIWYIFFFCFSYIYSFEILQRTLAFLGECVAHGVSGWSVRPGDSAWGSLRVRWRTVALTSAPLLTNHEKIG